MSKVTVFYAFLVTVVEMIGLTTKAILTMLVFVRKTLSLLITAREWGSSGEKIVCQSGNN